MKKALLLFLVALSVDLCVAQETLNEKDISLSTPYPVVDAVKDYFTYKDHIIAVKWTFKNVTLQNFDSKRLTLLKIKVYDDFPKGFMVEKCIKLKDRFFLFYSLWDKEKEKEQLFVREIDAEKCSFKDKGKLVFDVDGKVTGALAQTGFYSFNTMDKFDIISSFDESKLLIKYRKKPQIKNDDKSKDVIGFMVFDENLNSLSSKDVTMPYTEKKMDNLDYAIDADGNTYIASLIYRDNSTDG